MGKNPPPSSSSSGPSRCAGCCINVRVEWNAGVFGGSGLFVQASSPPCTWVGGDPNLLGGTIQLVGNTWYMTLQGYTRIDGITVGDPSTSSGLSTSTSTSGQYCVLTATAPYDPHGHGVINYDNSSSSSSTLGQPCPDGAHWTITSNSCGGTGGSVRTECDKPEESKIY